MFMRLVIFETLAMALLRRRWRSKLFSLLVLCLGTAAVADPLFPNSVASNDLDFIRPDDPAAPDPHGLRQAKGERAGNGRPLCRNTEPTS